MSNAPMNSTSSNEAPKVATPGPVAQAAEKQGDKAVAKPSEPQK